MPITWLDFLLLGVMLISGLLAMIRGFMREVLSIAAWAAAAVATVLLYNRLLPIAKANISQRHAGGRRGDRRRVPDHAAARLDHHGARSPT